jgi:hypothetical protein
MEALPVIVLFSLVVGLGIVLWMLTFGLDKGRITEYVHQRGGRVISISWAPFGRGWFGEKNARIYEVVYYDQGGNQHFATCKTSMWTGVYWTDDKITHRKSRWYDALTPTNEAGHSLIDQIDPDQIDPVEEFESDSYLPDERPERPAHRTLRRQASTDIQADAPPESLVDEVRRLREENARLRQELEQRGTNAG